jgi:hypothetical protein
MSAAIDFLDIYSEICLGTVAFMAIVATLRQTFGEELTSYQYLITRFFIDVGLVLVFVSMSGLGFFAIYQDVAMTWVLMAWMHIIFYAIYLPYYLNKRRKTEVERTSIAVAVIVSTGTSFINLVLAVFGVSSMLLPAAVVLHLVVALGALVLTFLIFVGSFMKFDKGNS